MSLTTAQAQARPARRCPRCRSGPVHRSHTRNALERAAKSLGVRPYRCSACDWRGWRLPLGVWAEAAHESKRPEPHPSLPADQPPARRPRSMKGHPRVRPSHRVALVVTLVALGAALGLAMHSCQSASPPPQQSFE